MTRVAGVVLGLIVWLVAGVAGLGVLGALWPDYAVAVPTKAYSTAMLIARLGVSVMASIAAGGVAARIGQMRAALAAGVVLTGVSAVIHVAFVWSDYPAWYHVVYLLSLVPVTALAGHLSSSVSRR